jgi:catechol 1,2-dioxygenase
MATNGAETKKPENRFDPNFTQNVIDAIGPNTSPRARFVFTKLIQHLHDFTREVELTIDEWIMGMQFLDEVGHMYYTSNKTRHEMHRISDITGLESYVWTLPLLFTSNS